VRQGTGPGEAQVTIGGARTAFDRHTLLADDFLSIGEQGYQLGKREWIDRHRDFRYLSVETTGLDVRHYDTTAIVRCAQRSRATWQAPCNGVKGLPEAADCVPANSGNEGLAPRAERPVPARALRVMCPVMQGRGSPHRAGDFPSVRLAASYADGVRREYGGGEPR
jgi:hypothetical protein